MAKKTLITNARIVTAETVTQGEIAIHGEKIVAVGRDLVRAGHTVIDAGGRLVLPGGVDVHTHMNLDLGAAVAQDDFYTGTVAAAFGGTTCIVDHPGFGPPGCALDHQIQRYRKEARGMAVVDYGLHGVLQRVDEAVLDALIDLVDTGIPSLKAYMTYAGRLDDHALLQVMDRLGRAGGLLAVHAENDAIIRFLQEGFFAAGKTEPIYHALSRPDLCEAEAVHRIVQLAAVADDAPLYVVHLSTAEGMAHVRAAQALGQRVFAETCPQYLLLDEERYLENEGGGFKYIMAPPARPRENQVFLWEGLQSGVIQVVATDHCPFDLALKQRLGADDFRLTPGGLPGVETRLPLLYSEGVVPGRLSLEKFVAVMATNPAKLMGLYPRKGTLAPGSDADLVIFDPDRRVTIRNKQLHQRVDYTPYEGWTVTGWPETTLVRGRVVVDRGRLLATRGYGRYIPRLPFDDHGILQLAS
ncbi:MAG: dihydropyrimidinase [Desulfosarcinaceae bacterium]